MPIISESGSDSYELASRSARISSARAPRPPYSTGTEASRGRVASISFRINGGIPRRRFLLVLIDSLAKKKTNRLAVAFQIGWE
jgi:hypothetical protein